VCSSDLAIASSSLATEWIKGRSIDDALAIRNTDIVKELALPPVKIHCSVLAEDAIRAAIGDWKKKNGNAQTVEAEPAKAAK
jgi:nitrogen fixation NifU-like protein